MKRKTINKLRKIYLIVSISIGIISPLICIILFPEFDPRIQPVSYFGIFKHTSILFMILLFILSISLWFNGERSIYKFIKRKKYKWWLMSLLTFACVFLCLTGAISMKHDPIHQIVALLFFLIYNFFVFAFGLARATSFVRKGLFSVIIGSLMLLSSLLLIPFPSYGVAEIVYIFLIFYWNISMFIKYEKTSRNK